ncbi:MULTISPECIES: hypothetical protein [Alphaproteobacteria]|uniref:hypothetical protein n=1 Tax=Alphaproteobacteria TaxID=28211 RepID=UPI0032654B6B
MKKKNEAHRRALAANAADCRREARACAEKSDFEGEAIWHGRMKTLEGEIAALVGG